MDSVLKILTTYEMYQCDKYTCQVEGITSVELMKRAGKRLFECIISNCDLDKERDRVLVVSGIGNNGGDGIVVGTHLLKEGYDVRFVIIGDKTQLSHDLQIVVEEIEKGVKIKYIKDIVELFDAKELFDWSTFIIDALFGIGLNRDVEGLYYNAIDQINLSSSRVFSIDIPSGIKW